MTILTPLPPAFGPVAWSVPLGWRSSVAAAIDDDAMSWDGRRVAYHDIASVAYGTNERSLNLVQHQVRRRIRLETSSDVVEIDLGRHLLGPRRDVEHHHLYQTFVDVLHARVEPRLRAELRRRIASGRTVVIAGLHVDRDGLRTADGARTIAWHRLPGAMFDGDEVTLRAMAHEHDDMPWSVSMLAPNAVLLPELLADCADVFV